MVPTKDLSPRRVFNTASKGKLLMSREANISEDVEYELSELHGNAFALLFILTSNSLSAPIIMRPEIMLPSANIVIIKE